MCAENVSTRFDVCSNCTTRSRTSFMRGVTPNIMMYSVTTFLFG